MKDMTLKNPANPNSSKVNLACRNYVRERLPVFSNFDTAALWFWKIKPHFKSTEILAFKQAYMIMSNELIKV
jgi:hypothetical protein